MKIRMLVMTVVVFACSLSMVRAASEGSSGPSGDGPQGVQQHDRDQIQSCDPDLEQDRTRLRDCLPDEVQQAVDDMTEAREQYQAKAREQKQDAADCTEEEREQLREQLREQMKEQAQDREQIRERLQELRDCLPSHEEVMDQAREQVRSERRGE